MPRLGIDSDARWGYSHAKGWIYIYKLHLTSTTSVLVVHLAANVTTDNVQDNKMYGSMMSSLCIFSSPSVSYMTSDPAEYDNKKLYEYSKKTLGIGLVCPVERYKSNSRKKFDLVCFYELILGPQFIYSQRGILVEPLIDPINSVFIIDQLPVYEFHMVSAIVLISLYYIR